MWTSSGGWGLEIDVAATASACRSMTAAKVPELGDHHVAVDLGQRRADSIGDGAVPHHLCRQASAGRTVWTRMVLEPVHGHVGDFEEIVVVREVGNPVPLTDQCLELPHDGHDGIPGVLSPMEPIVVFRPAKI